MNVGDLLGSGTISGAEKNEYGSLMELSWAGREPIKLETGETRTFIEDNDTLTLRGNARGDDAVFNGRCARIIRTEARVLHLVHRSQVPQPRKSLISATSGTSAGVQRCGRVGDCCARRP